MNNFVDTVFNTSATGNVIKYRIKHSDNTTEDVEISCITPITTQGTLLNKVLFDSIQADLNTRLLISNKASQGEAEAGTNDVKYMTPLKVKQAISYNFNVATGTAEDGGTIPKTSGYSHYAYFVSVNSIGATNIHGVLATTTSTSYLKIECSVNQSTRVVTCKGYQNRTQNIWTSPVSRNS